MAITVLTVNDIICLLHICARAGSKAPPVPPRKGSHQHSIDSTGVEAHRVKPKGVGHSIEGLAREDGVVVLTLASDDTVNAIRTAVGILGTVHGESYNIFFINTVTN